MIAGIDLSSFFVDIVFIDHGTLPVDPVWDRTNLSPGQDAFDRARNVSQRQPHPWLFDAYAIGIEDPRGMNPGPTFRVQGAVIGWIPRDTLLYPWVPSQWRKAVGLKGNAKKEEIMAFVKNALGACADNWPQDACDAWCVAEATRLAVSR